MNKFRIKEFSIRKFNSNRYLGVNLTKIDNHLLVYGEHKSGKSTTIDALAYSIFGINGSGRPINNIAETYIKLSNNDFELILKRKAGNNHKLTVKNIIDNTNETITNLNEINQKLIELFNLPNEDWLEFKAKLLYQDQESSLMKYDTKKLLNIISYYTGEGVKNKKIDSLYNEIKMKNEERDYAIINLKELKDNLKDRKNIISLSRSHIEHLTELISSYENKTMEQVFDVKKQKAELWERINQLQKRNIFLIHEKDKHFKMKNDLEKYYKENLVNLVKEIISVLICPVCGKRTNLSKVESKYKNKKCPYCGDDHYDKELYENITQRIQISNDQLPVINDKIIQIEKELIENYTALDNFNKQLNDLKLILNPEIVRSVERFESLEDKALEISIEEQKIDLMNKKNDFEKLEHEIRDLTHDISSQNKHIDNIKTQIIELEKRKTVLQNEFEKESINYFLHKLNHYYGRLMGYKKQPIVFEDGKLFFRTLIRNKKEETDDISASRTIGESEKRCLSAALLFTFIDLDKEYNASSIDFVILDDPADALYDANHLEPEAHNKTNLLNLIKEKCDTDQTQFIILTADKAYNEVLNLSTTSINFNSDLFRY